MSNPVNPDDFIITRKRKKYRFAHFANCSNCYELDEWLTSKGRSLSSHERQLVVEVGAGTALFSVELARLHPEKDYITLDVKADRLQRGARLALELGLENIWFVRARADQLLTVVGPDQVGEIWLTFSDPFPKKSDGKRRLTHPKFLALYQKSLHTKGKFYMKTDSHSLFDWSLEQLVMNHWRVQELTYDLHQSALKDEYKIMTSYEKRWISEGNVINFVSALPFITLS